MKDAYLDTIHFKGGCWRVFEGVCEGVQTAGYAADCAVMEFLRAARAHTQDLEGSLRLPHRYQTNRMSYRK